MKYSEAERARETGWVEVLLGGLRQIRIAWKNAPSWDIRRAWEVMERGKQDNNGPVTVEKMSKMARVALLTCRGIFRSIVEQQSQALADEHSSA